MFIRAGKHTIRLSSIDEYIIGENQQTKKWYVKAILHGSNRSVRIKEGLESQEEAEGMINELIDLSVLYPGTAVEDDEGRLIQVVKVK